VSSETCSDCSLQLWLCFARSFFIFIDEHGHGVEVVAPADVLTIVAEHLAGEHAVEAGCVLDGELYLVVRGGGSREPETASPRGQQTEASDSVLSGADPKEAAAATRHGQLAAAGALPGSPPVVLTPPPPRHRSEDSSAGGIRSTRQCIRHLLRACRGTPRPVARAPAPAPERQRPHPRRLP